MLQLIELESIGIDRECIEANILSILTDLDLNPENVESRNELLLWLLLRDDMLTHSNKVGEQIRKLHKVRNAKTMKQTHHSSNATRDMNE